MDTETVFARQTEQEAYTLLYREGMPGLRKAHPSFAEALVNRWAKRKLVRIQWVDGFMVVHAYKQYAKVDA